MRDVARFFRANPQALVLLIICLVLGLGTFLAVVISIAAAGGGGGHVTGDPGGVDDDAKVGSLKIRIGLGWAKSHELTTGQTPVMKYHRQLMMAILHGRAKIADAVNATVISLDDAPKGYAEFDQGASRKYVLDPHGMAR